VVLVVGKMRVVLVLLLLVLLELAVLFLVARVGR
jgi:hypothetical protein